MTYSSQVHLFLRQGPSKEGVSKEIVRLRSKQMRDGLTSYTRIGNDIDLLLDRWQRLDLEQQWVTAEKATAGE